MDITKEQCDLLKELIEDNNNQDAAPEGEGFLTEAVVRFVETLIWAHENG